MAGRRCSNYIFILELIPGFNGLGKDNCNMRQETFKVWDLVCLILDLTVNAVLSYNLPILMGLLGGVTDTMQWSRLCLGGPPPACRLDFGICVIQLRVPLEAPSDAEISASRSQAKDILDSKLRLGSAGSGHSVGSAGSQHSLGSYGSLNDGRGHSVGSAGSQHSGGSYGSLNDCLGASAPAADLLVQGEQLSTQELQGEPTGGIHDYTHTHHRWNTKSGENWHRRWSQS